MEEQNTPERVETNGRIYELAYIFVPTLSQDDSLTKFHTLKKYIEQKGAICISEDTPRLIELQYEMSRTISNKKTWFDEGYFGWIKFDIDQALVKSIHDDLARDEAIIRFMMIRTVRENTIASKKAIGFKTRKDVFSKESEDDTTLEKATEEEVDAAVDALVETV